MENKNNFVDFKTLIDRLKLILNITTDINIAEYLHLTYQSFAQMKRRNSLPYENLLILCQENNLKPLEMLEYDNKKFDIYHNTIINNNTFTNNIKLLDSDEYIIIPNLNAKESYRAYIDNNDIYIVDIASKQLKHNQTYIIMKNKIYYKKHITVDINGEYILTEPDTQDWTLSEKKVNELNSIAKVVFSYTLNNHNGKSNNHDLVQDKLTQFINLALKNNL